MKYCQIMPFWQEKFTCDSNRKLKCKIARIFTKSGECLKGAWEIKLVIISPLCVSSHLYGSSTRTLDVLMFLSLCWFFSRLPFSLKNLLLFRREHTEATSVSPTVIFLLISHLVLSLLGMTTNKKLELWSYKIDDFSELLSYFLFSVCPFFSSSSSLPLCWHPVISLWADGWAWEWMGGLGERGWARSEGSWVRDRMESQRESQKKGEN